MNTPYTPKTRPHVDADTAAKQAAREAQAREDTAVTTQVQHRLGALLAGIGTKTEPAGTSSTTQT